MPRKSKKNEFSMLLSNSQCYLYRIIFDFTPVNKTIGVIATSRAEADISIKEHYHKESQEIAYIGSIDKLIPF